MNDANDAATPVHVLTIRFRELDGFIYAFYGRPDGTGKQTMLGSMHKRMLCDSGAAEDLYATWRRIFREAFDAITRGIEPDAVGSHWVEEKPKGATE